MGKCTPCRLAVLRIVLFGERVTLPGQSESFPHQRCPFTPQMLIVGNAVPATSVPAPTSDRLLADLDPSSTSSVHTVRRAGPQIALVPFQLPALDRETLQ